jgi:hypothetical protein
MDDEQLSYAQDLHTTFRDRYMTEWLTYAEASSDAQTRAMMTQDWQSVQGAQGERRAEFEKFVDGLTDELFADIRILLTREQEDNWASLERDRRRERYLPGMSDNGVRAMDLVAITDLLGLDDQTRASLDEMLEVYAAELDGALLAYISKANAVDDKIDRYEKLQMQMSTMHQQGEEPDMDKLMELQEDFAEIGSQLTDITLALHKEATRVLDVNRQHTQALAREIPSHAQSEFERMTTRPAMSANPWMSGDFSRYKRCVAFLENIEDMRGAYEGQLRAMDNGEGRFEGIVQLMRAVEPLSADQKREVEFITADYEREMDQVRKDAARKAGKEDEDEQRMLSVPTPRGVVTLYKMSENGFGGAWFNGGDNNQDEDTLKRKAEIDQRAMDRLRPILTFYQRAAVAQN